VQPPEPVSSTRTKQPRRSITPQESYAAELQLLQRAQSEYASHDFANALAVLAEHGRRFPKGRLAEEREALRVRALAHAGRGDEARRALASFANRFPHSAFLPRLQAAAQSAEE
jgi:TolA-binding protein